MVIPSHVTYTTTLIGRQAELDEFAQLLMNPACRLLTLSGLGGIGKTRLAVALAQQVQTHFPDGVYFVPLQPLQSAEQIAPTIIATLDIPTAQPSLLQLTNWLRDKTLLLILDNFEHLMDGAEILNELLQAAPQIKILVTSRDALTLKIEWLRQIRGLDYPDAESTHPDLNSNAIQLFIKFATQQRGDLDPLIHYTHIARICQLVDRYAPCT